MSDDDDSLWERAVSVREGGQSADPEHLVLHLEHFEGPLDVLLTLARAQKVDLTQISILDLVEQYLVFIQEARKMKLELAADYLVMAAWLAYLKSRLLLPKEADEEEPSAEELALRLQLRLQRLEVMREMGARLMVRERVGRDIFLRGMPEAVVTERRGLFALTLYELTKAFGAIATRQNVTEIKIERRPVYSLEDAIERLSGLIGETIQWAQIQTFLPGHVTATHQLKKSAVASMFAASLELAKAGKAEISQMETFGPLYVRARANDERE